MFLRIPTVSVDNTVGRTVTLKVIQDLKKNLDVFSKAFVALENIFTENTYTSGVNVTIDKNSLEIPIVEKVDAKITSRKLNGLTVGNFQNVGFNIFKTKGLKIDTEYINTELVVSLTYKTKSKVNATKLEKMLIDHHITKGCGFYHDVVFYYDIPNFLLGLMEDIVNTRKINNDDGTNILDFIRSGNILNAITLSGDVNGLEGDVGLASIGKSRLHGIFDSELPEVKAEHDKDLNEWSLSVDYKTNYMSPEAFLVDFEILCNNTMLDSDKYLVEKMDNPDTRRESDGFYPMPMVTNKYSYDYVAIPPYDNHRPYVSSSKNIVPLMSILTQISLDDKKSLFNLNELEYYELDTDVLNYIKATKEYVVEYAKLYYRSIFMLDIYKDDVLMPKGTLTIDDDLNVLATNDLDITGTYRCVLSLIKNMSMIDVRYRNLIDMIDSDKIKDIYTGDKDKDYRVSDMNISQDIYPVGTWRMITAQVSTVQTFLKKGE